MYPLLWQKIQNSEFKEDLWFLFVQFKQWYDHALCYFLGKDEDLTVISSFISWFLHPLDYLQQELFKNKILDLVDLIKRLDLNNRAHFTKTIKDLMKSHDQTIILSVIFSKILSSKEVELDISFIIGNFSQPLIKLIILKLLPILDSQNLKSQYYIKQHLENYLGRTDNN